MARAEAKALGYGGMKFVAAAAGAAINTVRDGLAGLGKDPGELRDEDGSRRVRRPGGGRKKAEEKDPGLPAALSEQLAGQGHEASPAKVRGLMRQDGWRLQPNDKSLEKREAHPDRDAQFRYINALASMFVSSGLPVVSIGAKKKELAGNFASGGREWARAGEAPAVSDHGFPSWAEGKAIPYGVCDLAGNEGFASAGAARSRACKKHLAAFAGRRSLEEVTGKEMRQLERTRITRHDWHPEWNYTVHGADKPED